MKSKEFEALSKESQQQYFRLYIEFLKLKNKKGYKIDIIEAKTFEQVIRQLENYKK